MTTEGWTIQKPPHGSDEWRAVRWRNAAGEQLANASTVAAMWGQHDFVTPGELAAHQLAPELPPAEELTEPMERGHRFEEPIALWWAERRGVSTYEPQTMYGRGRIVCTIDREMYGISDSHLEVKSVQGYFDGELKPAWRWQGIAQRWCRYGTPGTVEWAILDSSLRVHDHEQHVTQDDLDALVARVDWWFSFIDYGIPPEGVDLAYADRVTMLPPEPSPVPAELPAEADEWIKALRAVRRERAELAMQEDDIKAKLAGWLGSSTVGTIDGVAVVEWKPTTKVDVGRLIAEHPVETSEYLRFDLSAFTKGKGAAVRKRLADQYRTPDGPRRMTTPGDDDE